MSWARTLAGLVVEAAVDVAVEQLQRASQWARGEVPKPPEPEPEPELPHVTRIREGSALTVEAVAMLAPAAVPVVPKPPEAPLEGSLEERFSEQADAYEKRGRRALR